MNAAEITESAGEATPLSSDKSMCTSYRTEDIKLIVADTGKLLEHPSQVLPRERLLADPVRGIQDGRLGSKRQLAATDTQRYPWLITEHAASRGSAAIIIRSLASTPGSRPAARPGRGCWWSGPYPLLILQGEQGSAKSTSSRVLRRL